MNAVKDEVIKLVEKELESANEKFPLFNSTHEGYAVIKEEVEEAEWNLENVKKALDNVWRGVRANFPELYEKDIQALKREAICGSIELIQVAAMAQKFIDSTKDKE